MKRIFIFVSVLTVVFFLYGTAYPEQGKKGAGNGKALFEQHCASCHPDGSNTVNAQKTLHKKDLNANGVKTAGDIVGKMRNPGPGMPKFDKKTIPDKDAKMIADYILKTFK